MNTIGGVGGGAEVPPQSNPPTEDWRLKDYNDQAYTSAYDMLEYAEMIVQDFYHGDPPPELAQYLNNLKQEFNAVGSGSPPTLSSCENFITNAQHFLSIIETDPSVPSWATAGMSTSVNDFQYWVESGEPPQN